MERKIRLGVSTCLLGENVRYNGGHKLNRYIRDTIGSFVEWVPVCPEVECGLGVPREAMRLVGDPESPRLVTINSGRDLTEQMQAWISAVLARLEKEDLCGFIFKSKSPSSGIQGVKIYTEAGHPSNRGAGLFGRAFMEHFPAVPVEDDGRLNDADIRENFIERVFVYHRWKETCAGGRTLKNLVDFHTRHKLLLMAHSQTGLRRLGKIVGNAAAASADDAYGKYFSLMADTLTVKTTVNNNVNVLYHIMGYFKKHLTPDEKEELIEIITNYHKGLIPLIVPVTLLNHLTRKYNEPYLGKQVYLKPHPIELMLRNHV